MNIGTCGRCNEPATYRMSNGKSVVKACDEHAKELAANGWLEWRL